MDKIRKPLSAPLRRAAGLALAICAAWVFGSGVPSTAAVVDKRQLTPTSRPSAWPQVDALRRWRYGGELPPERDTLARLPAWVEAHPDDAEAIFYLGLLHQRNVPGINPDPAKGPPLFERAAGLGFEPAKAQLALM